MRLRWLLDTWDDIQRLFEFLLYKDTLAAERAMTLIEEGANKLLAMPEIGRPINDGSDRRELYLPFGAGSYVLRYRLDGGTVVIIRVWNSREQRI